MKQIIKPYGSYMKSYMNESTASDSFLAKKGKYTLSIKLKDTFSGGAKFTYALSGGSQPLDGIVSIEYDNDFSFEMDKDNLVIKYGYEDVIVSLFSQIEKDSNFQSIF